MANKRAGKAVHVHFEDLVALLGKPAGDPAVTSLLKRAGKVSIRGGYIIAKEAGFNFSLGEPEDARSAKRELATLFLYPEGGEGHRGFADLPDGYAFTTRAELLASRPRPIRSWKIGGEAAIDDPEVICDTWRLGAYEIESDYGFDGGDAVEHIRVFLPKTHESLHANPLHFDTRPADAPPEANLLGMAFLVAWAADRWGLPAKHASSPLGKELLARKVTPRTFLKEACGGTLTTLDVDPAVGEFLVGYVGGEFHDGTPVRKATSSTIAKLLHLGASKRLGYTEDFGGTFKKLRSRYYVPDSWDALDRLAPILDARWADYRATKFEKPPKLALYEKAAALRDKVAIKPTRSAAVAPSGIDDAFADALVAAVGKPLVDKAVKALLARAELEIAKRIIEHANPLIGLSYEASHRTVGDKKRLVVDGVHFFCTKRTSPVTGLRSEVNFRAYPAKLPYGVQPGATRAAVSKQLGKPAKVVDNRDFWNKRPRRIMCEFKQGGLAAISVFLQGPS